MELFGGIIALLYFFMLSVLIIAIKKAIRSRSPREKNTALTVSVVMAVRNEEDNISQSLGSLLKQSPSAVEFIVVDDHSTDNTVEILRRCRDVRLKVIPNQSNGKKRAIETGVTAAKGDIIACTDADCLMSSNWIDCITNSFCDETIQLSFGAVAIRPAEKFFDKIQSMEFASLIGTGAATCYLGFPTMCNGANLAFRRSAFIEVGGYEGNLHIASGDDEFLMRKIEQRYPGSIRFDSEPSRIVETSPAPSMSAFLNQRLRWAGKWKSNSSRFTIMVAMLVVLMQLVTIYSFWKTFEGETQFATIVFLKLFLDGIFVGITLKFLKIPFHFPSFITIQIAYPLYSLGVGLLSNFATYKWKGRVRREGLVGKKVLTRIF